MGKIEWELIEASEFSSDRIERFVVPGGWIYRTWSGMMASTCFVPRPANYQMEMGV
jgi:hypothetical protein